MGSGGGLRCALRAREAGSSLRSEWKKERQVQEQVQVQRQMQRQEQPQVQKPMRGFFPFGCAQGQNDGMGGEEVLGAMRGG